MLTNGPLVGEAELSSLDEVVPVMREALVNALGDGYSGEHASAVRKLAAHLRAGERSWMSAGVWVEVDE